MMLADFSALPPVFLAWFGGLVLVCISISLWSIWHAFHREFPSVNEKMIWLAFVVFVPFVGGLAYLFVGRKRTKRMK